MTPSGSVRPAIIGPVVARGEATTDSELRA